MNSNKAFQCLQAHQIHPSIQRLAVMDYLLEHLNHPTVEEIFSALQPEIPTLSRTTVYNTLKLFAAKGAAVMLTIDEKRACFDSVLTPHAHFICRKCGRIIDVPLSEIGVNPHTFTLAEGKVEEEHLYYRGVCNDCLTKEQQGEA